VKRYFASRIGLVSTFYIAVLQLGTILPALLAVPVAAEAGWRISLGAWALVAVAAMLPWIGVLWIERRAGSELARTHDRAVLPDDAAPELASPAPPVRVWRTAIGWGMALMFGMTSLMTYALFTWLPKLLTEAGASPAFGGAMVALFAGLGLLGALVMPAIAVRVRNPFPIVLACAACQLVAYGGLLLAPMSLPLAWVSLLGLGGCTFPLSLTLLNKRTRTPAGSAALSGFTQGMGYSLACLGPLLFGLLHEATGSWVAPFAMLGVSVMVLLLGAWQACKPRYLEDAR
jgi:CP family cyanate transporter-like MFS transporter